MALSRLRLRRRDDRDRGRGDLGPFSLGHYWNWDPIETWSLVSWLLVGAVLHLAARTASGSQARLRGGSVLSWESSWRSGE